MKKKKQLYEFQANGLDFTSQEASQYRMIYAPLCGTHAHHIKSSITPHLSGDIKVNKERFLTKPASREDLRENVRDFFVNVGGKVVSLTQPVKQSHAHVDIGPFFQKLVKKFPSVGLRLEAVNFVPSSGETVELMKVTVINESSKKKNIVPTVAIPIFGRALSNKHDHEHVTSLLHRIKQVREGISVEHVMAFDEEGHRENDALYFVFGCDAQGNTPVGTFPTRESFLGEGGTLSKPNAIYNAYLPKNLSDIERNGKEAMGALRFKSVTLGPKRAVSFIIMMGVGARTQSAQKLFKKFNSEKKFDLAFERMRHYWQLKSKTIEFFTVDNNYNAWLRWVALQPILRRIFGCSFLPDHDYGKGGKGWRDIWQDLLSLILIEPQEVRGALVNNFAGVRIDGSNATIIGEHPGEFIADRNKITRVWMDHGCWPLMTLAFYIHQTGDLEILLTKQTYFRDMQLSRTFQKDESWTQAYGRKLKDKKGKVYHGTIIEHILVQHLVQFFNVGGHNITRLESADWNDGLDMGFAHGESVAFTSFYGGNFFVIAELLEHLAAREEIKNLVIAKEIGVLLDSLSASPVNYNSFMAKKNHLYKNYFASVQPELSGKMIEVDINEVIADLRKKGQWVFNHIRKTQKVQVGSRQWFNGYYDNKGRRVEGKKKGHVWMTLTGQVFPIMSGLANTKEINNVVRSVNTFLKDKELGGVRLNSDFGLRHYLDFGRAFGFAYGTKENGAFFSHMIVMYAYALYKRGFAREGYRVLQSIYAMCRDTDKSRIYPGIPEYFDSQGRGMYHYLTGSASWLVLTQLTQAFGVSGNWGDLALTPKLMKEEFDTNKEARCHCSFADRRLDITYSNPLGLDFGDYRVVCVYLNGKEVSFLPIKWGISIDRKHIENASNHSSILVHLGR